MLLRQSLLDWVTALAEASLVGMFQALVKPRLKLGVLFERVEVAALLSWMRLLA